MSDREARQCCAPLAPMTRRVSSHLAFRHYVSRNRRNLPDLVKQRAAGQRVSTALHHQIPPRSSLIDYRCLTVCAMAATGEPQFGARQRSDDLLLQVQGLRLGEVTEASRLIGG